ncbi:hypothetical protein BU14_0328s0002 [Porphyra umbilicalis]|uniref:Uncharacterized protein n=1 Tax=Porphyra umbilicalis TaxID=2786 RepID=A0A1X6NYP4_PORUM|nr:hypothetical protein BU14_0328s0002 [Porphyra umbilicalis]|eukprot:OSX73749.1 hypothetical protein BU14_0328s0002 [Porphyra umbilicalis]
MGGSGAAPAAADPACPYVETVQLGALDFDFPAACAVTLGTRNVSPTSPAYEHALHAGHHPFVHLTALTYHVLPDNTPLPATHPTLARITANIRPTYTAATLPPPSSTVHPVDGSADHPVGVVGLHPLRVSPSAPPLATTAYMAVAVHLLLAVTPVRAALLLDGADGAVAPGVRGEAGRLARKMGSPHLLRGRLTPSAFAAAVAAASGGVYGAPTREGGGGGGEGPFATPANAGRIPQLAPPRARNAAGGGGSPAVAKAVKRALRGKVRVAPPGGAAGGAPGEPPPRGGAAAAGAAAAATADPSPSTDGRGGNGGARPPPPPPPPQSGALLAALREPPPPPPLPVPRRHVHPPPNAPHGPPRALRGCAVPPPWLLIAIRRGGDEGPTRNRTVGGAGLAVHVRTDAGDGGGDDWWRLGGDGEVGRSEGGGVLGISEAHLLLYERRRGGGGGGGGAKRRRDPPATPPPAAKRPPPPAGARPPTAGGDARE